MKKNVIIKTKTHNIELISNGLDDFDYIVLCFHGFNGDKWGNGFGYLKKNLSRCLVVSFDSAGHGHSEISSLDMRLDIVLDEIDEVVKFLKQQYPNVPIIFNTLSYGAYRALAYLIKYDTDIFKFVAVNPAFNIVPRLEELKDFKREKLKSGDKIIMKESLGKFMTKEFIDDLYDMSVYNQKSKKDYDIRIIVGEQDTLIPRRDIDRFVNVYPSSVYYVDDEHCLTKEESYIVLKNVIEGKI